jgi:hypothetical protein
LDEFAVAIAKEIASHRNVKVARQTVRQLRLKLRGIDIDGTPEQKNEDMFRSSPGSRLFTNNTIPPVAMANGARCDR